MNIHNKFASNLPGGFREEDFVCTSDPSKNKFIEDHIVNILTIFDSNLPGGFREED